MTAVQRREEESARSMETQQLHRLFLVLVISFYTHSQQAIQL